METIYFRQATMATHFEFWLVGEDPQHLRAVGQMAADRLLQLEELMSRYDPAAELYRLNAHAYPSPLRTQPELFAILQDCLQWNRKTRGFFDISKRFGSSLDKVLELNHKTCSVQFLHPELQLDLGGYGKGYAVKILSQLMDQYKVQHYFIHGGTSSAQAKGVQANGQVWQLMIGAEEKVPLRDEAFACSAERCFVKAKDALSAEVLSTASSVSGMSLNAVSLPAHQIIWFSTPTHSLT